MQVKDIVIALGDFLEWTFGILPALGNIPNLIFLLIGAVMFIYWIGQMFGHARRGEN